MGQRKNNVYSLKATKGEHKGLKQAVAKISNLMNDYKWVFKTDIKSFYYSIDHNILFKSIKPHVPKYVFKIVMDYCHRVEIVDAEYFWVKQGLAKGGVLSPTLGNWYLKPMDEALSAIKGVVYVRYMDDLYVFTNQKQRLRDAVKTVYSQCDKLNLTLSKPKTFIGKTEKGISTLGYLFKPGMPLIASDLCLSRMKEKAQRLYEMPNGSRRWVAPSVRRQRVVEYLKKWWTWCHGGLKVSIDSSTVLTRMLQELPCEWGLGVGVKEFESHT